MELYYSPSSYLLVNFSRCVHWIYVCMSQDTRVNWFFVGVDKELLQGAGKWSANSMKTDDKGECAGENRKKKSKAHFFSIHKGNCSQFHSICCSTYIHLVRITQTWNWVTEALSSILSAWATFLNLSYVFSILFGWRVKQSFCISTFARVLQLAASVHKVISEPVPTEKWTRIFFIG